MISRALLNAPFFIPKDADLLRNRKVNTKKRQNRHLPELAFLILGTYFTAPRIKDANGKLVAIYAKTPEELYNKETLALEQINLYCSRRRTIMYSVEVHNGLYDTKRGRRKMGRDTS